MEEPTQKQQVTELLRQAESVVISTAARPSVDQLASVIALAQMLGKLGKRPEPVVSSELPSSLGFLPLNTLHKDFKGIRDFVIELDTSKTEADKLKYVPDGKRLKIYITPFNGSFSKDDLGFSYGDYHADALIMLGSDVQNLDPAVANQKQLLEKTKQVIISAGPSVPAAASNAINWHEPQASSLSEMLMSLTEALQPGLLDNHIATSLLTGLVGATEHFTAANTTPKVMTMAAQLMAAGADQGLIIKHLERPRPNAPTVPPAVPANITKPKDDNRELSPSQEQSLPHTEAAKAEPSLPPSAPAEKPPLPISPPPLSAPPVRDLPPPPKFAPPPPPFRPPPPAQLPPVPPTPQPGQLVPPAHPAPPPSAPPSSPDVPNPTPKLDVETARRAVEEATQNPNPPFAPTAPQ